MEKSQLLKQQHHISLTLKMRHLSKSWYIVYEIPLQSNPLYIDLNTPKTEKTDSKQKKQPETREKIRHE